MSALLAHIKIVEGHEKHFEELSRELYQKSHEMYLYKTNENLSKPNDMGGQSLTKTKKT